MKSGKNIGQFQYGFFGIIDLKSVDNCLVNWSQWIENSILRYLKWSTIYALLFVFFKKFLKAKIGVYNPDKMKHFPGTVERE